MHIKEAVDVSRLVARLQRGEYGIFVTTSYYTKAAQEEVHRRPLAHQVALRPVA